YPLRQHRPFFWFNVGNICHRVAAWPAHDGPRFTGWELERYRLVFVPAARSFACCVHGSTSRFLACLPRTDRIIGRCRSEIPYSERKRILSHTEHDGVQPPVGGHCGNRRRRCEPTGGEVDSNSL